jgi:predicted  nucleic acid-binding Zn-ribbon protein
MGLFLGLSGCIRVHAAQPVTDRDLIGVAQGIQNQSSLQVFNSSQQLQSAKTQLAAQQEQLKRFGDPNKYTNLLQLKQFQQSSDDAKQSAVRPSADLKQSANGANALGYTGQGLYSNLASLAALSSVKDKSGKALFDADSFKKFAVVQDMYEDYQSELDRYNTQMSALQDQLVDAMNKLNQASSQMETMKFQAQVNGLNGLINALASKMNTLGQRVVLQQVANQNDAARTAEANRQTREISRKTDMQQFKQSLFPGGSKTSATNN